MDLISKDMKIALQDQIDSAANLIYIALEETPGDSVVINKEILDSLVGTLVQYHYTLLKTIWLWPTLSALHNMIDYYKNLWYNIYRK